MRNITIKVKGMHCPSCEMLIKDVIEEQDGVEKAELSREKGMVMISFDEKKVNENQLKSIIKNEGYGVE
mgnify:CR=1 FL=1